MDRAVADTMGAHEGLARALGEVPRVTLALLPTPLLPAPRLTEALGGPPIWIKRDDLTGFGFGGNKVRILEYLLADAHAQGADTLVTGAAPQSNHVRATAAAAAHAGLQMVAVYHGPPSTRIEGNERLTRLLGAEVRYTGDPDRATVDAWIDEVAAELRAAGRKPYAIPRGGASVIGALGYVRAALELTEQCAIQGISPQSVVLATGSSGTQAGLLAGAWALASPWRVEGFTVSRPIEVARERVLALARATLERLHLPRIADERAIVHGGVLGEDYGIPTPEGMAAIELVARTEGIFLDPTYTGKAMAGLIAHVREGRFSSDAPIIFLHTGGEPALFAGNADTTAA